MTGDEDFDRERFIYLRNEWFKLTPKNMTAIEFLIDKYTKAFGDGITELMKDYNEQAKAIEKQQIVDLVDKAIIEDRKMLRQSDCLKQPILPKPTKGEQYYNSLNEKK